jgi:ATP-dependent Clp protease ATP-binding subunit ClpC
MSYKIMALISSLRRRLALSAREHVNRNIAHRFVAERFSPGAQAALVRARAEAQRLNHNFVGTEHLLLAIMHSEYAIAVKVLNEMGISPNAVRTQVEHFVRDWPAARVTNELPYAPRIKKALAMAGKEAARLQHSSVGTQHFLLGLLRVNDGAAARVFKTLKLDFEALRDKITQATAPGSDGWPQSDLA